jgi:hypothetical protein
MNSSEKPLTYLRSPHNRLTSLAVIAGILLCGAANTQALAKSAKNAKTAQTTPAADANDVPAIDPDTMAALNKMGVYLRSLKSFQVIADITTDDVLDSGQTIQSSTKVNLLASKPNRLRVEVTADDKDRIFFYNGKDFTVFGKLVNYYATVPAPPTIGKLIEDVDDKYGIELPLVDLFKFGTDEADIKKIKSAVDIGPTTVDGVTCEQYAFHQENIDWQIWVQLGDYPLPLKLVIQTLSDDAKPQHSELLTWNLAPSFNDAAFTFDPPEDAKRIVLADMNATDKKDK